MIHFTTLEDTDVPFRLLAGVEPNQLDLSEVVPKQGSHPPYYRHNLLTLEQALVLGLALVAAATFEATITVTD